MEIPLWLDITLQVVVSLLLLFIVYMITLSVLNIDAIVSTSQPNVSEQETSVILDGYAGPSLLKGLKYNTVNPYTDNFKRMPRSVNRNGGASFTYQFWIRIENANDGLFQDSVIFYRGDPRVFRVGYYDEPSSGATTYKLRTQLAPDYHVCCPKVAFGSSYKEFVITFNTNNDIYTTIRVNMTPSDDPASRKNLLSMMPMRWMLMTFVFEDNFSFSEDYENGIKFVMYVNDIPYWTETASSSPVLRHNMLKQNDGDLIFVPGMGEVSEFFKIANFKYYNYAVTPESVVKTYEMGPPNYPAAGSMKMDRTPGVISAVNKLDIYNY